MTDMQDLGAEGVHLLNGLVEKIKQVQDNLKLDN